MKILVILGHPNKNSYCAALHKAYIKGAKKSKAEVKELIISDLKFNPNFLGKDQKDEKDIVKARELIEWADHVVLTYPMWWGSMPAMLKGFFDRTFISGWAFKQRSALKWDKLLKGRTARVIITAGGLSWFYKCFGNPARKQISTFTFGYAGFKVKVTGIYKVKPRFSEAKKYLKKVENLGKDNL